MTATALNILGFIAPLIGIWLGALSFGWAERGATPDDPFGGYGSNLDLEKIMLLRGERFRARLWARMLFNVGALFLAAGVPLGNAGNHVNDRINLLAWSGYLIIACAVTYGIKQIYKIWQNLRDDAFNQYFNREMPRLYDAAKVRKMYFNLNRLPIWATFDAKWYSKIRLPDIHEVARVASKHEPLV